MEPLLKGKTALITGATSGIGRETAVRFVREGAKVIVTGRREDRLKNLAAEIEAAGGSCTYLAGDSGDMQFIQKLMDFAEEQGKLDILVCNAGMALRTPTLDMPLEEWEQVMRLNLTTPMFMAQRAIKHFLANGGGKIVFVSSTAGPYINPGASPSYGASKAGVNSITRHLANEFGKQGILVNAVCPGPIETEIVQSWTPEYRKRVDANLPLGRMGTPGDIADCILFLASGMSNYINGECMLANGGRYMR